MIHWLMVPASTILQIVLLFAAITNWSCSYLCNSKSTSSSFPVHTLNADAIKSGNAGQSAESVLESYLHREDMTSAVLMSITKTSPTLSLQENVHESGVLHPRSQSWRQSLKVASYKASFHADKVLAEQALGKLAKVLQQPMPRVDTRLIPTLFHSKIECITRYKNASFVIANKQLLLDAIANLSAHNDDYSVVSIGELMLETLYRESRVQELYSLLFNRRLLLLLRRSLSKICKAAERGRSNSTTNSTAVMKAPTKSSISQNVHLTALRLHQLLWNITVVDQSLPEPEEKFFLGPSRSLLREILCTGWLHQVRFHFKKPRFHLDRTTDLLGGRAWTTHFNLQIQEWSEARAKVFNTFVRNMMHPQFDASLRSLISERTAHQWAGIVEELQSMNPKKNEVTAAAIAVLTSKLTSAIQGNTPHSLNRTVAENESNKMNQRREEDRGVSESKREKN